MRHMVTGAKMGLANAGAREPLVELQMQPAQD